MSATTAYRAPGSPKRLLIMAAGTGGHIVPGLAIADTMLALGWQVSWLGTTHGMEQKLVPAHGGVPMDSIVFAGLRGKGMAHTLRGIWRLMAGFGACWRVLAKRRPDVVLGMGGYVTVPGGVMARLRGVPLVLVNADAALLLSNKSLAPLAARLLFGFPAALGALAAKSVVTGNPVRTEISGMLPPQQRYAARSGPLRLLVVGGSLGAQVLNQNVPAALALMPAALRPVVVHQSGQQHIAALTEAYRQAGIQAEVLPFIDDMPRRYAEADLVVCRAGAITVSELTAAGVASILVPLVISTTSHQRDNATYMAERGAARHLPQTELTPERLAAELRAATRPNLLAMAERARSLARPQAAARVADELERLVA